MEIKRSISRKPIYLPESDAIRKFVNDKGVENFSAILKQEVTIVTQYPKKQVDNSLQDNLFTADELGFGYNEPITDTHIRVAFIPVSENTTVEQIKAKLAETPKACIYKILSNEPILTDNDESAIEAGLTSLDSIAEKQVVRYGEGSDKAGEFILDKNGKFQYRKTFLSTTEKADIDNRTEDMVTHYFTPAMEAELTATMNIVEEGQEV